MESAGLVGEDTSALEAELTAYLEQDPTALRNPYPLYRRMREAIPVYRREEDQILLFRYSDVQTAFGDTARTSKDLEKRPYPEGERARKLLTDTEAVMFDELRAFENLQMSRTDDPTHARLRGLVQHGFTPRRVAALEEHIQQIVDELLDVIEENATVDFIDAFAFRLPLIVIFDMFGVTPDRRDDIRAWSQDIARYRTRPHDPERILAAHRAVRAFAGFVEEHITDVRASGGSADLMWALVEARYRDDRLSDEELTAALVHLLFAGHETTTNLLGNGLYHLLRNRGQWELLLSRPDLVDRAVEELLRFDTPVQLQHRIASIDYKLDDIRIAEGSHLILFPGSANRDPQQFADPETLDITREGSRHVSFGYGPHFCLGSALARLEGRIAFASLARRFPKIEIRAEDEALEWGGPAFRGLKSLSICVQPNHDD